MRPLLLLVLIALAMVSLVNNQVYAADETSQIPEKVGIEHWSCQNIKELGERYEAPAKVPEGAQVARKDLAAALLAVLEKVVAKCDKEGADGIPKEDLERLYRLHEALKEDLAQYEGYQVRREAIEKILAKPEEKEPPFEYKVGVGGFLRPEGAGNIHLTDFSYQPGHGEGRFLYRVKPYAYWHPTDWIDIHVEGQGYGYSGGNHQERSRYSLYQGYVEFKTPERDWAALKGGRQEFSYGSTFILGTNSFYDGLVFDAALLRVKPIEPLSIDLFIGAYAPPFNNGLLGNMAGAYATYAFSEGNALEAYLFRDSGSADHHTGEHLYILGLRGTAKVGPFSVEAEPVYEMGKLFNQTSAANDNIDAFGGHLDVTYESVLAGLNNKVVAGYAYGSGSRNAANGVQANREFRNPNNDSSLLGDMGLVGDLSGLTIGDHHASGVHIQTLGWGIDITKALNFSATGHYFIADYVEDGFSRNLGLETDFTVTYNVADDFSIIIGYDRFFTAGFFRDASGKGDDIHYGYAMLQFNLARTKPKVATKH